MSNESSSVSDVTADSNQDDKAVGRIQFEDTINFFNRARIMLTREDYLTLLHALGEYKQDDNNNRIQLVQKATYIEELGKNLWDMIRKICSNLYMVLFLLLSLVVLFLGIWVSL